MTTPTNQPTHTSQPVFMGQPRDKSLEAYKEFAQEMLKAIGGKGQDTMTEEKWTADWKAFWQD